MEIHPLSHVHIRPDGSAVVEVAVSVLDVDGLPVRAEGVLKMELHQRGRFGDAIMERRTWQRDLRDPADNLRAFDPTTRTYRVPLGLAAEDVPRSPAITATLVRPAAAALSAERSLEVLEPADEAVDAAESDAIPPADSPD
jgi:hypothetical protein